MRPPRVPAVTFTPNVYVPGGSVPGVSVKYGEEGSAGQVAAGKQVQAKERAAEGMWSLSRDAEAFSVSPCATVMDASVPVRTAVMPAELTVKACGCRIAQERPFGKQLSQTSDWLKHQNMQIIVN